MHLPDRLRAKRPSTVTTAAIAATLVACAAALACGPDFTQLLGSRKATLNAPVAYDFELEARRLVAPKARLPASPKAAVSDDASATDAAKAFARIEADGLSSSQAAKVAEMRRKDSGDEAWSWSMGKDVPEAVRLYTAAAVDFRHGTAEPEDLRRAAQRFEAVLALPEAQHRLRATWAAYSLGRAQRLLKAPDAAAVAFRRTREEAAKGAPDPFSLALSSLGEEARVELERGHAAQAVALYAEQAAQGDDSGQLSLHEVAEKLYADPALLKASIGDPLVRRLMVVYALSYGDSDDGSSEVPSRPESAAESAASAPAAAASAASAPASQQAASAAEASASAPLAAAAATPTPAAKPQRDHRMGRLLDAILQADAGQLQDVDRLAALAYAAGRYDLAAKLAPRSYSALASWVSAKLAMRQGRKDEAAQHYAAAVRAMAAQPDTEVPQRTRYHLRAEQGMVSLARADFTAALEQWWEVRGPYWLDLAYVAERVVTVDELKAFVDAHVPAAKPPAAEKQGNEMRQPEDPGAEWPAVSPANQLRDLLARRLMREGRTQEAFAYFHGPEERRLIDPDVRQHAKDYIDALHSGETSWTRIGRARSFFEAAQLARAHGMEIMGYELGPDSQAVGGDLDLGSERPSTKDGASLAEQKRYDASAAQPNERYHYRYIAAEHAVRAADALPPRSQAYAAVMCEATHWMLSSGNDAKARALYQRYLKQGAAVPWATHFGHDCPAPEFTRANWMLAKEQMHGGRVWARHHKPMAIGAGAAGAAVFAGLAWWVVSRVRRRHAAPAQVPQV